MEINPQLIIDSLPVVDLLQRDPEMCEYSGRCEECSGLGAFYNYCQNFGDGCSIKLRKDRSRTLIN